MAEYLALTLPAENVSKMTAYVATVSELCAEFGILSGALCVCCGVVGLQSLPNLGQLVLLDVNSLLLDFCDIKLGDAGCLLYQILD